MVHRGKTTKKKHSHTRDPLSDAARRWKRSENATTSRVVSGTDSQTPNTANVHTKSDAPAVCSATADAARDQAERPATSHDKPQPTEPYGPDRGKGNIDIRPKLEEVISRNRYRGWHSKVVVERNEVEFKEASWGREGRHH